ncbi:TPA: hypothetical protein ACGE8L_004712 [Yersinia enterocolitica]|nr:inovirus-type Gp2 protein [Yersinia enterocolitica]HEK7317263.1 inovirus-type Gp2 protein [Yersinia enterocolitica]HEN3294870.1 inovirus-type Gp2 protein [Yersinia enterocolitica]
MTDNYNANPNYEMHPLILADINEHLNDMFFRYSRVLPVRIDFGWRKTSGRYQRQLQDEMVSDMHYLINSIIQNESITGYYWVLEYSPDKGFHVHAVFYLNGQKHNNAYLTVRFIGDEWARHTSNEGYFYHCKSKKEFVASIERVVDHRNNEDINNLRYIISYLAKKNQKDGFVYAGRNKISVRNNRGRPRRI